MHMYKKLAFAAFMLFSFIESDAQTGTWSGKLDLQGTKLSIVFHLDGDNPTIDSPDQGAKGIAAQVERGMAGKIIIKVPSLAIIYEGQWLINKIVGTFNQIVILVIIILYFSFYFFSYTHLLYY